MCVCLKNALKSFLFFLRRYVLFLFLGVYPEESFLVGWARRIRATNRFSAKQKNFIEKLFNDGATTKNKLSAEMMSLRMREEVRDGQHYFEPEQYLLPSQIRGLITRFSAMQKGHQKKKQATSEEEGINANIDEICDEILADN